LHRLGTHARGGSNKSRGRLHELLRWDSSRSGWAVGEHTDLVHHHGVPVHCRTVLLKSP
jgi:hypothetical protein